MKPVVQIWVTEEGLQSIVRGQYPSIWWRQGGQAIGNSWAAERNAICISVTCDWFVSMRDYEKTLEKDNDLPF
jgi:hypothetical protein